MTVELLPNFSPLTGTHIRFPDCDDDEELVYAVSASKRPLQSNKPVKKLKKQRLSPKVVNISYNNRRTDIKFKGLTCLDDLRKKVRAALSIKIGRSFIEFLTNDNNPNSRITTWLQLCGLPSEYFEDGGSQAIFIYVVAPSITTAAPIVQQVLGSVETDMRNLDNSDLQQYLALGLALKDDPAVAAIVHCLKTMVTPRNSHRAPFVYLESSSGLGKSQTSFALIPALDTHVFYFLYTVPNSSSQRIYQSFIQISKLFKKCVKRDSSHYKGNSPSCSNLIDEDLYVFGFIGLLLEQFKKSNALEVVEGTLEVEKMSGKELQRFIDAQYPSRNCRPTFIIDECNMKKGKVERFRFVRNIFRCLGVWLVMLGTDSQAAQLGDSMGSASRRGDAFMWCHIFNKLPRLHLPSLELPQNLPQNIRSVITKSRPWFAHLGATYWRCSENPSLDGMMTFVYHKIVGQKNIFETEFGRLGQVHLVHNTSYVAENSSSLIHEHFGQLDGMPNFTLNSWLHVEGTGRKWVPKAVFPTVEKDPLLFLSLLGPQSCPAFVIDGLQVPFAFFLQEQENSVKARKFSIHYQNSVQRSNDGMQFETLLCACICVASHCQGVRGARVDLFLQDLVYNLQRIPQPTNLFSLDLSRFPLLALEGFVVPFLSPPNQQWPSFVESCGNFGNLMRAKNADKVDILTSCGLSAEVKDWSSPLPSEDLTNIIVRAPIDSKLHVVLVRKLQEAYYTTGKSFSEAVGTELSNRFAVCKVNLADRVPAIHAMNGIPISNASSGVILFIVCSE